MSNEKLCSDLGNILERIYTIFVAANYESISKSLYEVLDTPEKVLAYHLSDGRTTEEVLRKMKMSSKTLPKLWKFWNSRGLGMRTPVRGGMRFVRLFSLEDFGFKIDKEFISGEGKN
jgi:hypothetical protein